jgi:hypothetical protein
MDPSNHTHSDIPNQRDNTSLHKINYCLTLTSYFIEKKIRPAEQQPYFFAGEYLPVASEIVCLYFQSPYKIFLYRVHYLPTQPKQM